MAGMMNAGKSYQTRALLSQIPKKDVVILDPHNDYGDFEPVFLRTMPTRPYDVSWVNDLIQTGYDKKLYHKVFVFDDLDLFVKHDRESSGLADWFIDSSHMGKEYGFPKEKQGSASIILMKRPRNLDKRILQSSRFIFLFKGCLFDDVKYIQENCGVPELVLDAYYEVDKQPLENHPFLIIDNNTKTFSVRKGLVFGAGN